MRFKHLAALLAMLLALGCAGESTTTTPEDSSAEPDSNTSAASEVTDPAPDAEAEVETQIVSFNVVGMK